MKFDLMVGNPPYEGKGKPLYLQILAHLMPYAKEVVWICPSKWTKTWKDIPYTAELKRTTLNCLIDHENIESPFEDTSIAAGISVYHFGEADKYESYEDLKCEKFSNVDIAKSIISKLEAHESIDEHVWSGTGDYYVTFEIMRGHSKLEAHESIDEHVWSGTGDYYVTFEIMRGNHKGGLHKWDWLTLMPEDWREDYSKRKIESGESKKRCQFSFATKNEAKNFRISTETDIAMFAINVQKSNRAIIPSTLSYIPWLGDYTRSWNDDQIAAELGLTKEELDYIHEEMKNFGWKCAKKANRGSRSSELESS